MSNFVSSPKFANPAHLSVICAKLADCLHHLRGVRFANADNMNNADLLKALELGEKAHKELLAVIDEIIKENNGWIVADENNPPKHDELYYVYIEDIVEVGNLGLVSNVTMARYHANDKVWYSVEKIISEAYDFCIGDIEIRPSVVDAYKPVVLPLNIWSDWESEDE